MDQTSHSDVKTKIVWCVMESQMAASPGLVAIFDNESAADEFIQELPDNIYYYVQDWLVMK